MNNLQNINIFFNELRLSGGAIWLDKEAIKFSAPKKFQNRETDELIRNNKDKIILILKENDILSKEKFQNVIILKDKTTIHYPLSSAQERLWFIEQYEEGTTAYHIPSIYELDSSINKEGIKYAVQQIVLRHEVLRSTIEQVAQRDNSIQKVHDEPLLIEEVVLTNRDDYDFFIKKDINRPFDLSKEYPMRVKFYTIKSKVDDSLNKIVLLINTHHIVSDGWSENIFRQELLEYYEAYINNDNAFSLPALEIQYKDYALWQKSYLTGEILEKQLSYWKEKLSGYQTLELLTDYARPSQIDYRGAHHNFTLNKKMSERLRVLALTNSVTLNSVALTSIIILLNKYTGQDDIVTGSIIANRHHRQTKDLIGFFTNTLACRTLLDKSQSFEALIQQVHQDQIEAQLHQDLPFEKLVNELGVERDSSRHPIFQVMFTVDGSGYQNKISDPQKEYFKPYEGEASSEVAKFDITINIDDRNDELEGGISYATSLFKKETIERFAGHYIYLLEELLANPNKPYSEINILDKEEYNKLIYEWNETDKNYTNDKTIYELFEAQVKKTPDHIALVYEGENLTYRELNEKSNQLARRVQKQYKETTGKELSGDTLIALYLDRSFEMVIGILAVLKSGGAYVPMDTSYPQERIDYLLADTKSELILSQRHLIEESNAIRLPKERVIPIDLTESFYKEENKTNLKKNSKANDLAYVIYTSGTTGRPKGVMVEHHQVLLFAIENNFINYEKAFVVAGISNYAFDGSVFDLFFSLLNGKQLILINRESLLDLVRLDDYLMRFKVDTIFITTALFNSLVQNQSKCLDNLDQLLFGGERCNLEIINNFKNCYQKTSLVHVYGPTENIVYSTYCNLSEYNSNNVAPIGKHLSDKKLYVLDTNLLPVPIGVIGELYIGGAGLARGYLNRDDLTQERFIPNLYSTELNKTKGYARLYKTGDLVRWLADGNIEYIGRNDDQVKIRGYRIELGEIEHALTQITGVKQACVLAKEKKSDTGTIKYLVGYYVLDANEKTLSLSILQEQLSKLLPDYMVPAALVAMESFPLTVNGKLDKRVLPDPIFGSSEKEYVAPFNSIEISLCKIWQDVLGLEKVSVTDNFFRIGGDSILSIQVSSRIRQAGFSCQVKDIFDCKTISKLAEHLNKKQSAIVTQSEQGILAGELGLLPIQNWFIEKINKKEFVAPDHFNQSFLVKVPVLEIKKLEKIINELASYHDVLRICYVKEDKKTGNVQWKQFYQEQSEVSEIKILDVSKHNAEEIHSILTSWQSGFNLERCPLFQAGYLYGYEDGSARLYFALHHMIVDAVSWRILTEDVKALYEGRNLPTKGSSYRQWVSSMKTYSEKHQFESNYWEEQLKGMPSYEIENQEEALSESHCELDKELTRLLLQEASNAYHTEVNDLLLTSLAYALKDLNGNDIQGITLEGHGREDIDSSIDHSHTVGWFTTIFPVKLEIRKNVKESIQSIKDNLRSIPNKGVGYGSFATRNETNYSFNDLAPISFNYLGQFETQQSDWQIIAEDSGSEIDPVNMNNNMVNINGMVNNGKLRFSIVTKLGADATKKLSEDYKIHLTKIINHCIEKIENKGSSYTPSDFKSVKISQSLLDKLQSKAKSI